MLTKLGRVPLKGSYCSATPANTVSSRRRLPDQVLMSTYVPPYERIYPPAGMVAPDLKGDRESIHR